MRPTPTPALNSFYTHTHVWNKKEKILPFRFELLLILEIRVPSLAISLIPAHTATSGQLNCRRAGAENRRWPALAPLAQAAFKPDQQAQSSLFFLVPV